MGSKPSYDRSLYDDDCDEIEENYCFKPYVFELQCFDEQEEETPYPRSGHRIVCSQNNFYSFGGFNPDFGIGSNPEFSQDSLFPELWQFNFASMKWKKLPVKNVPRALASNAVVLSGKILIVYGGTGVPFHLERSNSLYICNLGVPDLEFKEVNVTGNTPPALYGQAAFMKDSFFYTIGGTTGFEYYIDIHRLNLRTNIWEEVYLCKGIRNEPSGRYRHELAVVSDKVYVIGGGTGNQLFDFESIYFFDLLNRKWDFIITLRDTIHGYPKPRQFHSVVNVPGTNSFVMVGGLHVNNVLDDAWSLDISSMKWTKIHSLCLCTPVYFHSSSITPAGKAYTFGGVTKKNLLSERVHDVQCAWLCIPKLKDICWEAVVHYGLLKEIGEDSRNYGLPIEFSKQSML